MAVVYVMGTHASGISILFPIDVVSVDGLFTPLDAQSNLFIYYGHQGDRNNCLYYRGVCFREVGFIRISVSQGPKKLYARGEVSAL